MNDLTFALVLISACLHAGWNFFAKKTAVNKTALLCMAHLFAGVIFLPFTIYLSFKFDISSQAILIITLTSIIHAAYFGTLGLAYEYGELSVVYPIARGLGIALTTVIAILTGIDSLNYIGVTGILIMIMGILSLSCQGRGSENFKKSLLYASCVALCIGSYSIVDKIAVEHIHPLLYIGIYTITSPLLLFLFIDKKNIQIIYKEHKKYSALVGIFSLLTYSLILWAFQYGPASYIVALRELSILVAMILGITLLKEEMNKFKVAGVVFIIIGAIFIKNA